MLALHQKSDEWGEKDWWVIVMGVESEWSWVSRILVVFFP